MKVRDLTTLLTLITLSLSLGAFSPAWAETSKNFTDSEIPVVNLPDRGAAGELAEQISKQLEPKTTVMVYHLGDSVPGQLRYAAASLQQRGFAVNVKLIKPQEIEAELVEAQSRANQQIFQVTYQAAERASLTQAMKDTLVESGRMLKQITGVPGGVSIWQQIKKVQRSAQEKSLDRMSAHIQSVLAGGSLGFSLYMSHELSKSAGPMPHFETVLPSFMAWVWAFGYWNRGSNEIFRYGKTLAASSSATLGTRMSDVYFYSTSIVRAMMTNAIVVMGAFGPDKLMTWGSLTNSFRNAVLGQVAGGWVNKWISDHIPPANWDPETPLPEGAWTPKKVQVVNTIWQFTYGMVKNFDLLAKYADPSNPLMLYGGRIPYLMLFVGGVLKLSYDRRHSVVQGMNRALTFIRNRLSHVAARECESYLVIQTKEPPALPPEYVPSDLIFD